MSFLINSLNPLLGSREYDDRAITALNQCYKHDERKTQQLVDEKLGEWGDKSILDIANVEFLKFMGSTCCDKIIRDKWSTVSGYLRAGDGFTESV